MAMKKESMEKKEKDLWKEKLIEPIKLGKYAKDIEDAEKIIVFGESNSGKTRWYMKIIEKLKKDGLNLNEILMCVIFSDRPTGITKLVNVIPKEFVNNILLFPINNYEELISATAVAEQKLKEHKQKTGKLGWLVTELLNEPWGFSQDYYTRQAYGENLGDYFSERKQLSKAIREDASAYKALEGWKDWTVIKWFHNFNWVDKIKRMPYNVLFTAEIKEEGNKDSIFADLGFRPSGEKSNLHRVDTILYLSHKGNKFTQACYKLTGYSKIYSTIDITNKNGYEEHKKLLKRLEDAGLRTSKIEDIEKEAGIEFKPEQKEELKKAIETEETKKEPEKTITVVTKEGEEKISKKELTETAASEKPEMPPKGGEEKTPPKKEKEGDDWSF